MEIRILTRAAIIAVLYVVLTVVAAPISYGPVQFRISEALTVLPFFEPAAIWGLFTGVLIANIFGGNGLPDIIIGSLLTLIAAYLTWKIKKPLIALVPPVIINAFGVAAILWYVLQIPYFPAVLSVGFGQLTVIYLLGLPLLMILLRNKNLIRKDVLNRKFKKDK